MAASRCAICGSTGNSTELYPPTFDPDAFTPAVFSARRMPDRVHYRMVRCNACGLVRSDPVAAPGFSAQLYRESGFTYGEETENLARTYGRYLATLADYGVTKGSLLEIGCGSGFFLEQAAAQGYADARGIEPSRAAVAAAEHHLRARIVCDVMREGIFPAEEFDAICMFQVLDHMSDPAALLEECRRILNPAGLFLCLNHNASAWSARLLKSRSPIVDIEHTYLFSPATERRLFTQHGFSVLRTGSVRNTYTLEYLTRLLPLPGAMKPWALRILRAVGAGRLRLSLPLGNFYLVAQRTVREGKDGES